MQNFIYVWNEKDYGQFITYKTPVIVDTTNHDFIVDDIPITTKYFRHLGTWYEIYERLYSTALYNPEMYLIVFELERDGEIMKTLL